MLYYTSPCKDDVDDLVPLLDVVKGKSALSSEQSMAPTANTLPSHSMTQRRSIRVRQQSDRLVFNAEECAYSVNTLLENSDDFNHSDAEFGLEVGDALVTYNDSQASRLR